MLTLILNNTPTTFEVLCDKCTTLADLSVEVCSPLGDPLGPPVLYFIAGCHGEREGRSSLVTDFTGTYYLGVAFDA